MSTQSTPIEVPPDVQSPRAKLVYLALGWAGRPPSKNCRPRCR
ncbi:hypothetical protein [Salinigranum rubrum]|nr:hypothetical protein [Salinigranum rubrum]